MVIKEQMTKQLTVDGAEDPNVVVATGGGADDAVVVVDHLHELTDDERHGLDPLHLLLRTQQLALEVLLLVLHVLILDLNELHEALQRLEAAVEVVVLLGGNRGKGGGRGDSRV